MRDLRVSVTDRCNFRCAYCMPRDVYDRDHVFLPRDEILTFEEIERLVGLFAGMGVEKIRLTGGEPLLHDEMPEIVRGIIARRKFVYLCTNGLLLKKQTFTESSSIPPAVSSS